MASSAARPRPAADGCGRRAAILVRAALLAVACAACAACADRADRAEVGEAGAGRGAALDPPAATGAFAPNLARDGDALLATWLEPAVLPTPREDRSEGHRLRFARLTGSEWSDPVTIARGSNFFANWADFPAVIAAGDGTLWAHWLAKTADDTYAYSIFLARSSDGGLNWETAGRLNADTTPTEHGFVTYVGEEDGVRAFWLDGRAMVDGEPMALRSVRLGDSDARETILDERVCECCGTDSALSAAGPLVVYRDRSQNEVRDISIVRRLGEHWTQPRTVAADGWRIEGCPVNGPAVDARGESVAVAWFTAGGERPRVQVALSDDAGASFGEVIVVDGNATLGRVDVLLDADSTAWITWMSVVDERAEIMLAGIGPEGEVGAPRVVGETSLARASGFPILERLGDHPDSALVVAWVEIADDRAASRIRLRRL